MRRLLDLPLRILVPAILIVFSLLVTVGVTFDRLQREEEDIQYQSQLDMIEMVQLLRDGISDRMLHDDLISANMRLSDAALSRNVIGLYLIDPEGRILLTSEYALRGLPAAQKLPRYDLREARDSLRLNRAIIQRDPENKDLYGYFPVVIGQEQGSLRPNRYGILFVDYDLGRALEQARGYAMRQSLMFATLFMLFTAALVLIFRWRVTRRVAALAEVVTGFSGGTLDRRAELTGNDELAYLGKSFNGMADRLTEKNRQLESEVEERTRVAAELRVSRQMLQLVLDTIPVGVFWKDRELRYLGCNQLFARDAGLASPAEIIGLRETDLRWRDEAERYEADDLAIVQSGQERLHAEEKTVMSDGTIIWLQISKLPLRDEQGAISGLLGTYQDITQRKRAEEALRRYSQEVEDLYENAPCGYHSIDPDGVILRINQTELRWLGYRREDVIGKLRFPDLLTPASLQSFHVHFPGFKKSGSVHDLEFELVRRDGSTFHVLVNATAIYDERHQYVASRSTVYDITDRKLAENALAELNRTLEQRVREELAKNREKDHMLIQQSRLAAMGEMVHNIAHQWRQPLNLLGLVIAEIKDDYQHGALDEAALNRAIEQSQRLIQKMSTTIDDFRYFFRPDKEKQTFDIASVVDETIVLMEASLKNNSIQVDVKLERPLVVEGYPSQYSQALLNILVNAKEAILQRQVRQGLIRIFLHRQGGKAVLRIEDNGGGIPEEVMVRLFDPYFTTKEQGSGIGLYMTKMIIENSMNGTVKAENIGEGARFIITLPLLDASPAPGTLST